MRYRLLDGFTTNGGFPTFDYVFGRGPGEILFNTPAVVGQAVLTRLNLWQGEWFLDDTEGTPWLQQILSAQIKNTVPLYDQAIKQRVLLTPNVTSIIDYSSNLNTTTRHLVVSMKIDTAFGAFGLAVTFGPGAATQFQFSLDFSDPRNSQYLPIL